MGRAPAGELLPVDPHLEGRALAVVVAILLFQASTWWQLLAEVPVQLQGYQGSLGMLVVVVVVLVAGLWPGGRGR